MLDLFRTFLFETVIDPSEGTGEVPAGAEPTEAEAGAAVEAPEATAPTEASWSPSRDEWEQNQQVLSRLGQLLDQQTVEEEPLPEFDPFADDANEQMMRLAQEIASRQVQAQISPLAPILDRIVAQEGDQIRDGILNGLKPQEFEGETETRWRETAQHLAGSFFDPGDPSTAQQAVEQGAKYAAELIQKERTDAVEAYKRDLAGISEQPAEPGAGGGALPTEPKGGSYDDIIDRWAARQRG